MTYPIATLEQIEFYREHGWLAVELAIPHADLDELARRCESIIDEKETLANDWAWDAKESTCATAACISSIVAIAKVSSPTAVSRAISNHLQALGTGGEGHHYPWRVFVKQRAGEQRPSGKS